LQWPVAAGLRFSTNRRRLPVNLAATFLRLRDGLPKLNCTWIKMIEEHGSLRKASAAITARIRRS
jgi:hypothetical protein